MIGPMLDPLSDILTRLSLRGTLYFRTSFTEPWGVRVSLVEVKDVLLPEAMQRAMARQAEAEREKRAKIIHADGEFQAAGKLTEAADIISQNPQTLQLRFLLLVHSGAQFLLLGSNLLLAVNFAQTAITCCREQSAPAPQLFRAPSNIGVSAS